MVLALQDAAHARPGLVLRAAALVCELPDGDIAAMAGFLGDVQIPAGWRVDVDPVSVL